VKHDHKCGYDGGINRIHDGALAESTEFNRIMRVSFIELFRSKISAMNCFYLFVYIFHSTNVHQITEIPFVVRITQISDRAMLNL
jgi:hypothetical protein